LLSSCGAPEAASRAEAASPAAPSETAVPAAPAEPASPVPADVPAAAPAPTSAAADSALAAFRATVMRVPERLEPAAATRDALVRGFVRAIEANDTTFFRDHVMNRGEFAYFFYPESEFTRPPRELPADFVWFYMQQDSEKGIGRALARHGGEPMGYTGYACAPQPRVMGRNRLWEGCVLRRVVGGQTVEERWFGSILERDGRFKFVSFVNRF
ncbi:MAG TPA: hypothetical protein VK358_08075, partial [Longimicrobium sp.]|nr:hypothetical protein [Longimicrobium sp.]